MCPPPGCCLIVLFPTGGALEMLTVLQEQGVTSELLYIIWLRETEPDTERGPCYEHDQHRWLLKMRGDSASQKPEEAACRDAPSALSRHRLAGDRHHYLQPQQMDFRSLQLQHHIIKYTAMMPICLGASFSIMGEVQFDQIGCFFVFAATMLRGVKSIQQSILLQEEKINSVFLLYLMSIPSFCILAVAALALENWAMLESPLHYDRHLWVFILLSCLGSVMYNLASCSVITLTSAVTLHVLGNLNVVGNLLLSQLLFGSELSALSCAGAVLTLSGMLIYQNSEFIVSYMDARKAKLEGTDFKSESDGGSVKEEGFEKTNYPQRVDEKEKMD
ncbi:solute carrier family 35 member E4 isoform X3 [Gambusia affinis]|uniref:solute carrier family 35 member E4 isoform X3 n=1 Tax=Gambusia affinis TaxID=33528 RepID=UPI001CDD26D2|nr:solute carrier family 35 member E4 isoform X3 [Gambusia affinis]